MIIFYFIIYLKTRLKHLCVYAPNINIENISLTENSCVRKERISKRYWMFWIKCEIQNRVKLFHYSVHVCVCMLCNSFILHTIIRSPIVKLMNGTTLCAVVRELNSLKILRCFSFHFQNIEHFVYLQVLYYVYSSACLGR